MGQGMQQYKMQQYRIESGSGKHQVTLMVMVTGGGVMLILVGGDTPHLGAVVLSIPRPSLADHEQSSCTTSVLPLVGHKDDEAARPLAEMVAKATLLPVSVSAGIHIEKATEEDIKLVKQNVIECGIKLLNMIDIDSL